MTIQKMKGEITMKHRIFALFLSLLLLAAILTGCSASTSKSMAADSASFDSWNNSTEASAPEAAWEEPAAEAPAETESFATSAAAGGELDYEQSLSDYTDKIIYSANITAETTDFDKAVAGIESMVNAYQGFVESSSVYGNTRYNDDGTTTVVDRHASYTLRIPAAKFEQFMTEASGIGNVTSSNRYAENVTSAYTDYEARLSSLNTQEERLLAMLEKSEDVDTLVALESRLADVRYEIESIERNLRNMDLQISYSTVNLDLDEVEIYTPTAPVQRTFGQKLSDAFRDGWQGFARGGQRLLIGLTEALPALLLLAVIVLIVVLCIRRSVKKRRAKKAAAQQPTEPPQA